MIQFQHVFKSYGRSPNILVDLNFRIKPGEFIFVSGPSGAGKSTLLRLIGGLEAPTRGAVFVQGNRVDKLSPRGLPYLRRAIGLILQDIHLLNDRRAIHNVMLPLEVLGIAPEHAYKRARAALEKVGLSDKEEHYPIELSGGEQQRLAIARAIVNRPAIVIADEPTANLDDATAKKIMDVFLDFNQVGVTTLIASHDHQLMRHYARRTFHIEQGRFSDHGSWPDFHAQPLSTDRAGALS